MDRLELEGRVHGTIIDMHLHTTRGASDSMLDPHDLVEEALRADRRASTPTEHDPDVGTVGPRSCPRRKQPRHLRARIGMEVSTDMGHIITVGLKGYQPGIRHLRKLREIADEQVRIPCSVLTPLPALLRPRALQAGGEGAVQPDAGTGSGAPCVRAGARHRGAERVQHAAGELFRAAGGEDPGEAGHGGLGCAPEAGNPRLPPAASAEQMETAEQFVEALHSGKFYPGRELPSGNLNNYWETAEPIPFYE
ncbi:MAG: hypothetical protein U5Q44_09640 [Dehalococcoidia bacterium]|nr:hypothetical protein [Dehalococcoidia bacterium]